LVFVVNLGRCNLQAALPFPLSEYDPYEDGVFRGLERLAAGSRDSGVRARKWEQLRGDGRVNSV
jgi:hypothetical protein